MVMCNKHKQQRVVLECSTAEMTSLDRYIPVLRSQHAVLWASCAEAGRELRLSRM
jgi:hypothetical protein